MGLGETHIDASPLVAAFVLRARGDPRARAGCIPPAMGVARAGLGGRGGGGSCGGEKAEEPMVPESTVGFFWFPVVAASGAPCTAKKHGTIVL